MCLKTDELAPCKEDITISLQGAKVVQKGQVFVIRKVSDFFLTIVRMDN